MCTDDLKYDRAYKTRRSSPRTPIRPTKPAPPLPLGAGSSYVMDRARNEFVTHVRPKIDRLTKLSTTGFQLAGQSLEQTIHLSKTHSTKIGATISSVVGGYLFDAALDTYHGGRFWPPSSPVPLSLFPCFSSMSDKKISRSLSSKIK